MIQPQWYSEVDFIPHQVRMLTQGHVGEDVRELQRLLKAAGYPVSPDGNFGRNTASAVRAFQRDQGLVVDGKLGAKTEWVLRQQPKDDKILTHEDLRWAAETLKAPVAAVMAVNEVESRGSGFFDNGRPAILFERHIMRRRLIHHKIDPSPHLQRQPNLVNTATGGYHGGVKEYERLTQAEQIHAPSALESASWGLFQIMGFHWQRLNYQSAQHFVDRMHNSERDQLEAFVRFIMKDNNLLLALRQQDWKRFARTYNGPAYAKHKPPYDQRMATAFATHQQAVTELKLAA